MIQKSIMPFKNKVILKTSPAVRFFLRPFQSNSARKDTCQVVTGRRFLAHAHFNLALLKLSGQNLETRLVLCDCFLMMLIFNKMNLNIVSLPINILVRQNNRHRWRSGDIRVDVHIATCKSCNYA